ncbi:MAG: iron-sulfur cluster assembly accessory protein [Gemmatimonadaceae bacterium]|nr:iron-sulfur cluster assembly accessory protein [Gemmatimonadaceae bacterium]
MHDENASRFDGVSGHAGLFSTGEDLARVARMWLSGGTLDGVRFASARTVSLFTQVQDLHQAPTADANGFNSAGKRLSARAFGHTGFTGTSLWIDPSRDLFVILLTNRVNPTRENRRIGAVRAALADAVEWRDRRDGGPSISIVASPLTRGPCRALAQRPPAAKPFPAALAGVDYRVMKSGFPDPPSGGRHMSTMQTPDVMLSISAAATVEVKKFLEAEAVDPTIGGLRVAVQPGGCSGFKYSLLIEDKPAEDDTLLAQDGFQVFVDPFSMQYLNGIQIDYTTSMQGSGFTFKNPNATGGCGCGSSFSA